MKKWFWSAVMPLTVILGGIMAFIIQMNRIPDSIFLTKGSSRVLEFDLPFSAEVKADTRDVVQFSGTSLKDEYYEMDQPLTLITRESGSTSVSFDLFGWIPVKSIEVTVGDEVLLYPGGQSIGVMLYTDGALVVGSSHIERADGTMINPAETAGLKPGDIIISANGVTVQSAKHLAELVNEAPSHVLELNIRRSGKERVVRMEPVCDDEGVYKLGVWVRDSTAGVGTLTFYEPETGTVAGLGHAITDVDTGSILQVKNGDIILSEIKEVIKGAEGAPGELRGSFDPEEEVIGSIIKNTDYGVYAAGEEALLSELGEPMIAAARDEVCEGEAELYCSIDDNGVQAYQCMIEKIERQEIRRQKSFVVKITDKRLLERTGGIVQGMSGSPIIQNNRLIGAVTHVFLNDPTRGYGIYIDWMLQEIE